MINNYLFLFLMISHFIGDFYLQSDNLANEKENELQSVFIHSLIYCVPCMLFILVWDKSILLYLIVFLVAHLLIDLAKFGLTRIDKIKNQGSIFYIVDQFLHMMTIVIISLVYTQLNSTNIELLPSISNLMSNLINIERSDHVNFYKMILLVIIIFKPAGITFSRVFVKIKPEKESATDNDKKNSNEKSYGKIIGYLERILIIVLLMIRQYDVIGWVIAGKSLARLNSDVTAEYYIIGTFYSISLAIVSFLLIWNI